MVRELYAWTMAETGCQEKVSFSSSIDEEAQLSVLLPDYSQMTNPVVPNAKVTLNPVEAFLFAEPLKDFNWLGWDVLCWTGINFSDVQPNCCGFRIYE